VALTHTHDLGDRWRVITEVSRHRRIFEAIVPKDANLIELKAFLEATEAALRRKMVDPQAP